MAGNHNPRYTTSDELLTEIKVFRDGLQWVVEHFFHFAAVEPQNIQRRNRGIDQVQQRHLGCVDNQTPFGARHISLHLLRKIVWKAKGYASTQYDEAASGNILSNTTKDHAGLRITHRFSRQSKTKLVARSGVSNRKAKTHCCRDPAFYCRNIFPFQQCQEQITHRSAKNDQRPGVSAQLYDCPRDVYATAAWINLRFFTI